MRTAALLVLTLTALRPGGAAATTTTVTTTVTTTTSTSTLPPTPVTAVCPLAQNPCLVTTAVTINNGSTLDFGQRDLVVTPTGSLNVGSGLVKIFAGSLDVQPKGAILGNGGGWIMVTTTGSILVEGSTPTNPSKGTIDVSSSNDGGEIDLTAGDATHPANITIAGILNANGSGDPNADGGTINITANNGNIAITSDAGDVSLTGGNLASGGTIDLESPAGSIQVTNQLDASGGDFDGGEIDMDAHGDITIASLNVDGAATGSGGTIDITADGNIVASGQISGQGAGSGGNGGDGADVCLTATGSLQLNAKILTASGDGGTGGCLDIEATNGSLLVGAPIAAQGTGSEGCGGAVTFVSGTDTTMTPGMTLMDLSGGPQCGGGTLDSSAGGTVSVSGEIDADHDSGLIGIVAPTIVIAATADLHADVGVLEGGGEVNLFAQNALNIASGAQLSSAGPGGLNLLQSCGTMTVQAKVSAVSGVPTPGQNQVQYWQTIPVLTGAVFNPAPIITSGLAVCAPPPSTTSTSVTFVTTSTSTPVTAVTSTSVTSTVPATPSTIVASTSTTTTIPSGPQCTSDADCDASSSCDHCVAGACTSSDSGLPAVTCRLTDLANALHTAAPPDIRSAALKRKLTAQIGQAVKQVGKAKGKHPRGFLKKARAQLVLFSKLVRRNLSHSIDPAWGNHLTSLADTAASQLMSLAAAAHR